MLVDNHNRAINYLRLAVTDRCNLRCNYCMPEEGIEFAKRDDLLTMEELCKISSILVEQGIDKIRLTGGEPFVRKDLMVLIRYLAGLEDEGAFHILDPVEGHAATKESDSRSNR